MKALYVGLMVAGLVFAAGCNTSPSGGKPGEPGGDFELQGPPNFPEISIKQGENLLKDITVKPGKNFKEDIVFTTKVEPADQGVTAALEPTTWKASDAKKVELHIKAGEKAKTGEYTIHVTGKPAKGNSTELNVKVKVPEKK